MKKTSVLVFLAMSLILCSAVLAQDEDEGQWRNFEVGITAGLTIPSNIDWYDSLAAKNGMNYSAFGGYYLSERFCIGSYFTYSQMSPDVATTFTITDQNYKMYRLGFYGKYVFTGESNFEPYVKVSAGINFAKFATWVGPGPTRIILREISYDPAFSSGAYLGFSYFTSDYGALFLEVSYHFDKLKNTPAEHGGISFPFPDDIKYVEMNAGVVVFFGPE